MCKTRAQMSFSPLIRPNFSSAAAPKGDQEASKPLRERISTRPCRFYPQIPFLKGTKAPKKKKPTVTFPAAQALGSASLETPTCPLVRQENSKTSWFLRVRGFQELGLRASTSATGTGKGKRRRKFPSASPGKGGTEPGALFYPRQGGMEPVNRLFLRGWSANPPLPGEKGGMEPVNPRPPPAHTPPGAGRRGAGKPPEGKAGWSPSPSPLRKRSGMEPGMPSTPHEAARLPLSQRRAG